MKSLTLVLATLVLSLNATAALLTNESSGNKLEKVTLSSAATYSLENEALKLTEVGAGLRAKKVVFVNIKVYVGELFVSDITKFSKENPIPSLKDQKAVAIQLHFLRSVDSENVQKSFKDALKVNGVNLEDSSVKQFLDAVIKGGESKEGKSLTVVGAKLKDGSEMISYETTSGTTTEVKGAAGFVDKIFSIWLGKPSDDGVGNLKKSMLK